MNAGHCQLTITTHLQLGRVSNLPTVWSNVIAASVLSGATLSPLSLLCAIIALSLFYVAGMYLNDAFDADIDAIERPERPIPSGRISTGQVTASALVLFIAGFLGLWLSRTTAPAALGSGSLGWLTSAIVLLVFIVAYNKHHKSNNYSPVLMAACRAMVLITASYTLSTSLPTTVLFGATMGFFWLMGLTYIAKQEPSQYLQVSWPLILLCIPALAGLFISAEQPVAAIPLAALIVVITVSVRRLRNGATGAIGASVGLLIAGISLLDALLIASQGAWLWMLFAIGCFALTLMLQRRISGT
ncbi:MAG: UbiA family prenyltransferase [Granulosicoccus sp.]